MKHTNISIGMPPLFWSGGMLSLKHALTERCERGIDILTELRQRERERERERTVKHTNFSIGVTPLFWSEGMPYLKRCLH